jgi:hypothetical protein
MPLGKRSDFGDAKYAGAESVFTCDIVGALQVHHGPSINSCGAVSFLASFVQLERYSGTTRVLTHYSAERGM